MTTDRIGIAFPSARVSQVRIARPTDRLEEVITFYRDGLGLRELGRFCDHDGYDGVMLGLPQATYHLEFTQHRAGSPCPAPSADNLLVLYIPDSDERGGLQRRLESMGYRAVDPANPYWRGKSVTFEDPDGWRAVLCGAPGI